MIDAPLIRPLRIRAGLSQAAAADRLSAIAGRTLTQPEWSRIESGQRAITPALSGALDRLLAVGEQSENEAEPFFALVRVGPRDALEYLLDHDGNLGLYVERRFAEVTLTSVQAVEVDGVHVAPTWAQGAFEAIVSRAYARGRPFEVRDALRWIDTGDSAVERALAAGHHAAGILTGLVARGDDNVRAREAVADLLERTQLTREPVEPVVPAAVRALEDASS